MLSGATSPPRALLEGTSDQGGFDILKDFKDVCSFFGGFFKVLVICVCSYCSQFFVFCVCVCLLGALCGIIG